MEVLYTYETGKHFTNMVRYTHTYMYNQSTAQPYGAKDPHEPVNISPIWYTHIMKPVNTPGPPMWYTNMVYHI